MNKNYAGLRAKAMAWVKSKRDFSQGIAILQEAEFRPSVMRVLARHGQGGPSADERLLYHMREFIKLWFEPSLSEDTDTELGVVDGKVAAETTVEEPKLMSEEMEAKIEDGEYPYSVAELIKTYRADFIMRDKIMKKMAEVPEDNTDENVALRKQYSDMIQKLTDQMDDAYLLYRAYVDEGKLPEEKPAVEEKAKRVDLESEAQNMGNLSKSDLQRVRKSLMTKIKRSQNMLDYQQETEASEPNPLPAGKKRIKYESKIARLREEVDKVEIEIAKRG